jgi:hypothetical protein
MKQVINDEANDWLWNLITFIDNAKMEKNLTTESKKCEASKG